MRGHAGYCDSTRAAVRYRRPNTSGNARSCKIYNLVGVIGGGGWWWWVVVVVEAAAKAVVVLLTTPEDETVATIHFLKFS